MKVRKLNVYNGKVDTGVSNEYPTSSDTFRQPCLHFIVDQRLSGKSYLTSKILEQAHKDKVFDIVYLITPSFNSNKAYFGKYVQEENVLNPTKDSIGEVIRRVEQDRDDFEQYLKDKELYKKYQKDIHRPTFHLQDGMQLMTYLDRGFFERPPKWKYQKQEPPKSLLILDDVLGSPAIMKSSGLTRIATLNRHIAPLKETHSGRSACGLAVIILCQTYRMNDGIGRCLRENVSVLTLFKNKQEKQLAAIKEELANVIDTDLFDQAYAYATNDKYGNLSVDFNPKCSSKVFRKNLNEIILFDSLKCTCQS